MEMKSTDSEADKFILGEAIALFSESRLTAGIYVNTELNVLLRSSTSTDEKVTSSKEWGYSEFRTLRISFDFTGTTGERKIVIKVPVGVVFSANGYPTEGDSPGVISSCNLNRVSIEIYRVALSQVIKEVLLHTF